MMAEAQASQTALRGLSAGFGGGAQASKVAVKLVISKARSGRFMVNPCLLCAASNIVGLFRRTLPRFGALRTARPHGDEDANAKPDDGGGKPDKGDDDAGGHGCHL